MIKLEHFNQGGFDPVRYLTDMNPGQSISKIEGFKLNPLKVDDLKILVNTNYNLKKLLEGYYNNNVHFSFYKPDGSRTHGLLYVYYTESFRINEFNYILEDYKYIDEKLEVPKINFVSISDGECYLIEKNLPKKIEIDTDNSYNLTYSLESILKDIRSDKSGLMLFTGLPGTGKSSLIKYLSQENLDKKFCFISNSNLDILSSPNFTEFCMNNLQNAILVLEDCEKALLTRDLNKGYDISNILNLTDGIYGDVLNIKIIATLNTVDKIDSALLRKGRLICKADFKKLSIEQGQNLAKKLNKNIDVKEELQLCEIYNIEDNGGVINSKQSVGFSM